MKHFHTYSTIQIVQKGEDVGIKQGLNEISDKVGQLPFVASKRGVYYYPIKCSKAQSLSVKNMLYFKDKMDAERAGYKAYLGCFD